MHARYAVLLGDQQLLWKAMTIHGRKKSQHCCSGQEAIMASRLAQLVAKELLLGPDSGTLGENDGM